MAQSVTQQTQIQGGAGGNSVRPRPEDDLAEIDLVGLFRAVVRRWKLCALICTAVVAAGLAYCFLVTVNYQTTSRVHVNYGALGTTAKDEEQLVLAPEVMQKIFVDFDFVKSKKFATAENPLKEFRKLYEVKEVPKSNLLEIKFKDPDVERSAAVNLATAKAYIDSVRARVRTTIATERAVLERILAERTKARNVAAADLEKFKSENGILDMGLTRSQTTEELSRVGAASAAAAADTPLLSQAGSARLAFTAVPAKTKAAREQLEKDRDELTKELQRLDALQPKWQVVSGRYNTAQANYQAAYNAVQAILSRELSLENDSLGRVVVAPSTDEDFVKKSPQRVKVMAILILAAIVLSVLTCIVLELLDRTLKSRGEFERAGMIDVLGEVKAAADNSEMWRKVALMLGAGQRADGANAFVVVAASPLNAQLDAARNLKAAFEKAGRTVCLASTGELEGVLASKSADIVLVEAAPLSVSADALAAASKAGVKVLVTGELYVTKREELVEALAMLDRAGANVAGAVIAVK